MARRKPSLNRVLGITSAKRSFARATGIPTTRSGQRKKIRRVLTGGGHVPSLRAKRRLSSAGGCLLPILLLFVLALAPLCSGCAVVLPALLSKGQESSAIPSESIVASPVITPSPTPTPSAEPTPTPAVLGSRQNPLYPGEACSITVDTYSGQTVAGTITLTQILRGPEVLELLLEENRYNPLPADGKEYLLAEFSFQCESIESSDDSPFRLSMYDFKYSSESFSLSSLPAVVHPKEYPKLSLQLYAGASGSGWVCFEVGKEESAPYGVYSESLWFKLSSDTPASSTPSTDLDTFLAQTDQEIKASLEDIEVSTSYNGEAFSILITASEGMDEGLRLSPNVMRSVWTDYVDALLDYNLAIRESFIQTGYSDIPVDLILVSDADPSNMLFSSRNGHIVYNVLELEDSALLPSEEELQPILDWMQSAQTKGRHNGERYEPNEIEDEELEFLATYFFYCMNGREDEALALFADEAATLQDVERGNLDMDLYSPEALLIDDQSVTLTVKGPSGEYIGFGTRYSSLSKQSQMLIISDD